MSRVECFADFRAMGIHRKLTRAKQRVTGGHGSAPIPGPTATQLEPKTMELQCDRSTLLKSGPRSSQQSLNYMDYDQLIVQQLLLEGDDGAGVPDSKELDLGSDPAGGATPFMAARMPCVQQYISCATCARDCCMRMHINNRLVQYLFLRLMQAL